MSGDLERLAVFLFCFGRFAEGVNAVSVVGKH